MITITTGLPGHGKTLYTIEAVEKLRLESGRPVYYKRKTGPGDYGIDELQLPWQELPDPERWFELPAGAIIVIDECQRLFVKRPQSGTVPLHVSKLETHRHDGYDLFLITQDAKNIDSHARRLIEQHWHVQRLYGTERFRLYTWQSVHDPSRKADRDVGQQQLLKLNAKFYAAYKSAEVHTVKRRLPWKWIAAAVVGLVVIPLLAVRVMTWFHGETVDRLAKRGSQSEAVEDSTASSSTLEREKTVHSWEAESFVPRVGAWQWSAPFYDDVRPAKNPPRIVGCFMLKVGTAVTCRCSNGQGDAKVTREQCRDFLAGRYYDPARPFVDIKAENIAYLESRDSQGASAEGETVAQSSGVARAPSM